MYWLISSSANDNLFMLGSEKRKTGKMETAPKPDIHHYNFLMFLKKLALSLAVLSYHFEHVLPHARC